MSDTTIDQNKLPTRADIDPREIKVRMDKSRAFSTIHGTRGPGDPHYNVHFYQDGVPFDAQGFLILDHVEYDENSREGAKRRETRDKKVKKYLHDNAKRRAAVSDDGGVEQIEAGDEDEDDGLAEPVNLEDWVRGKQQVEWNDVTQTIAQRYKKRIAKIDDAVPFLVDEMKIPAGEVAKKFQRYL